MSAVSTSLYLSLDVFVFSLARKGRNKGEVSQELLFEETDMPSEIEWQKYFRPKKTLFEPFGLRRGMTLYDLGCGYGTFSIPAAQIVGARGLVYSIDIDKKMVGRVLWRARRKKTDKR